MKKQILLPGECDILHINFPCRWQVATSLASQLFLSEWTLAVGGSVNKVLWFETYKEHNIPEKIQVFVSKNL